MGCLSPVQKPVMKLNPGNGLQVGHEISSPHPYGVVIKYLLACLFTACTPTRQQSGQGCLLYPPQSPAPNAGMALDASTTWAPRLGKGGAF